MKTKHQKIGRNDKCPCGSGRKYKKCHMEYKGNPGVLKKVYEIDPTDYFVNRFIFGLGSIRDCAIEKDKRIGFDRVHNAVFQNLYEMKMAKHKCLEVIENHKKSLELKEDGVFQGNQITVTKPIDDELNLYFKDFFIRGLMATRGLMKLSVYLGHNIEFFFSDDEKKFKKGLEKFPIGSNDERFITLNDFIKGHQMAWYRTFREMRRKIEHEGWHLPKVHYVVQEDLSVQIMIPPIDNLPLEKILDICWNNIINFCEEITTFLLGQKLGDNKIIFRLPEEERSKHSHVQYIVSHKAFPGVPLQCS